MIHMIQYIGERYIEYLGYMSLVMTIDESWNAYTDHVQSLNENYSTKLQDGTRSRHPLQDHALSSTLFCTVILFFYIFCIAIFFS